MKAGMDTALCDTEVHSGLPCGSPSRSQIHVRDPLHAHRGAHLVIVRGTAGALKHAVVLHALEGALAILRSFNFELVTWAKVNHEAVHAAVKVLAVAVRVALSARVFSGMGVRSGACAHARVRVELHALQLTLTRKTRKPDTA